LSDILSLKVSARYGGVLYKRGYYMPVVWVMLSQH
jgi:hypothetical protein